MHHPRCPAESATSLQGSDKASFQSFFLFLLFNVAVGRVDPVRPGPLHPAEAASQEKRKRSSRALRLTLTVVQGPSLVDGCNVSFGLAGGLTALSCVLVLDEEGALWALCNAHGRVNVFSICLTEAIVYCVSL